MKTFKVTMRYPDGSTMFMGTVLAEEVSEATAPAAPAAQRNGAAPTPVSRDTGERMTDPQKRYLFRLLGAQGVEGKRAEEHLKTYFKVTRLADIAKQAASDYINQLVKDQKDAANGAA